MTGYDGKDPHRLLIAHAKEYLIREGYTIKEWRGEFLNLRVPCIPDIVAIRRDKYRDTYGRAHDTEDRIIVEVETNPTSASIKKKTHQFLDQMPNWTLIILDCRKIKGWRKGWSEVTNGAIYTWLKDNL